MDERKKLIAAEIVRLSEEIGALDRDFQRIPYLFLTLAFAIPAYFWGGVGYVFSAILCALSLVSVAYYLIGVRRVEARSNLRELNEQLGEKPKKKKSSKRVKTSKVIKQRVLPQKVDKEVAPEKVTKQ